MRYGLRYENKCVALFALRSVAMLEPKLQVRFRLEDPVCDLTYADPCSRWRYWVCGSIWLRFWCWCWCRYFCTESG